MSRVTPALAMAAGLPVFVACDACHAASRALDLRRIARQWGGDADLAEAARAGRFRCSACGARRAQVMPTLAQLIVDSRRLRIHCVTCAKDRAYTAVEACERFGLATPFDALRRQVRCRTMEDCQLNAGAMIATELTAAEFSRIRQQRKTAEARLARSDKARDCGFL